MALNGFFNIFCDCIQLLSSTDVDVEVCQIHFPYNHCLPLRTTFARTETLVNSEDSSSKHSSYLSSVMPAGQF